MNKDNPRETRPESVEQKNYKPSTAPKQNNYRPESGSGGDKPAPPEPSDD